jgi:hypothetical protein
VRHFEASVIIKAECAKWLPITFDHPGGCPTELVSEFAKGSAAIVEPLDPSPLPILQGLDEFGIRSFDTQKLCVRLSSIEAVLGGG